MNSSFINSVVLNSFFWYAPIQKPENVHTLPRHNSDQSLTNKERSKLDFSEIKVSKMASAMCSLFIFSTLIIFSLFLPGRPKPPAVDLWPSQGGPTPSLRTTELINQLTENERKATKYTYSSTSKIRGKMQYSF